MPPRTRTRVSKVLQENVGIVKKISVKSDGKVTKIKRKALADKTNSLSDDNASIDIPIKTSKKTLNNKDAKPNRDDNKVRPKRERRLPPRYVENQTLKNLYNGNELPHGPVASKSPVQKLKAKEPPTKISKDAKSETKHETHLSHSKAPQKEKEVLRSEETVKNADQQVSITKYLTKEKIRPRRNCRVQPEVENICKSYKNISSPFKVPANDSENSLVANRPKRDSRLPSRFEDHSISPTKFIPVQPCYASTPISKKNTKTISKTQNISVDKEKVITNKENTKKPTLNPIKSKPTNTSLEVNASNTSTDKSSPDTNNNGKNKVLRPKRGALKTQTSPVKSKPFARRILDKSLSFRVLEDRKSNEKGLDVYEFTFDPNEEPTPPKKKRKRPVKKRPPKPKTVVHKSNYNDNVSKALAHLKAKVKPSQTKAKAIHNGVKPMKNVCDITKNNFEQTENHVKPTNQPTGNYVNPIVGPSTTSNENIAKLNIPLSTNITDAQPINDTGNSIHASNYASIRVEDIAADFEFSDHHNDINYSPVTSPHHQPIAEMHQTTPESHEIISKAPEPNKSVAPVNDKDPLNLQEVSFFEEPPVASSSMNVSVRLPQGSPWRVEFGSLPMRWHNNTYVKPNMTPAVESSFVNSEVTKKKHVYTNMITEPEPLPEIFEPAPALKQTSIISFIKEVAEKKAKKKRGHSQTSRAVFDDITGNECSISPKKAKIAKDLISNTPNKSSDKENSHTSSKSTPQKKKDKDCTYFGFDESENMDQDNVSLVKVNPNPKTRVLRSRNVLQELNSQAVPARAAMPLNKAKLTSSEVVEQLYDQLKSAEDAQFPVDETAKEPADNTVTNVDDLSWHEEDDSQSVHLFEDIEVVHHLKPHRKSYGKAKKVTFQHSANSDSDEPPRADPEASDDDEQADLSFYLPTELKQKSKRTKKKKPKKQLTKKEEKEVEEWAAGFNSMCEDIDEFPLLVE